MLPVHRTSHRRKRNRRAHDSLARLHTVVCPNCGSPKMPHGACSNCGYVRPGLILKRDEED